MSIWEVNGETSKHDVMSQRTAAGTIAGEHGTPNSFGSHQLSNTISPLDPRMSYTSGSVSVNTGVSDAFLGIQSSSHQAGSTMTLTFVGTSITIIGQTSPDGGVSAITVDGAAATGKINTYTYLAASYGLTGLNKTDTTITVSTASAFGASGTIIIDAEQITYSGKTGTTFTGCTRGANGTTASGHQAAASVVAYSSSINFASTYKQSRVTLYSKTDLSLGRHVITLTTQDNNYARVDAWLVGGLVGAPNLNVMWDFATFNTMSTGTDGVVTVDQALPSAPGTNQHVIGILGAFPIAGPATYISTMWNPITNTIRFGTNAPSESGTIGVVVTFIKLGGTI